MLPAPDTGPPARLLLVDDHTAVREGMKRILSDGMPTRERCWEIIEAGSGAQALACLRSAACRLAVVDLSMPGLSGLALLRQMRAEFPALAILVLSMHAEEPYALRALMSGANGYAIKDSAAEELLAAVQRVGDGGTYVAPGLAERVAQHLSRLMPLPKQAELSGHELEVMRRVVAGQPVADIADELHVSAQAVSAHRSRTLERLRWPGFAAALQLTAEHRFDNGELAPGGGSA